VLGPQSDPVGITTKAPHNVVKAYRLIAKAGTAGTANYVSRGGTPGTTVEEHAIWALTHGVTTCDVDAKTGGGGESPSTTTGSCPPSIDYPHWYHVTGDTQGPNVENADVCNYDGGNCYVLTDRGTYQYLAATNAISSLKIVASDNHGAAPGGSTLLVNSFHAYAVNPAEFANDSNVHINLAGAEAFLNWLTSPQGQADVGRFEADSGNPPFLPDAAPAITVHAPRHVNAGKRLTITGSVSNVVPGTPPLKAVEVDLDAAPKGAAPSALTTTATNAVGKFRLHYRPTRSRRYAVSTPQIAQIEQQVKDVGPFGDILQPSSQAIGRIPLQAKVTLAQPTERNGRVRISGELSPRVSGRHGRLIVMAASGRHALHKVASVRLAAGAKRFGTSVRLTPGRAWRIAVRYRNTGVISATKSITRTLVV
jgi:ABC-type tungstate transport system permease subunit